MYVILKAETAYPSRFLVGSVLFAFLVFYVVVICVFTFLVRCCAVRYDFGLNTMFGSSLPQLVCKRARVLFALFVFVCE